MTSRLNIKFLIPMVLVTLVIVAACYFAATKFVFKSAEQHAKIAERAMADGHAAIEAGNIVEGNSYYVRAADNCSAAFRKDPRNTEYLYLSMVANRSFVCTQLTEAENRLGMIFNASRLAHDATGADLDDQRQYYELLMERHRMGLLSSGALPWIAYMNESADAEVQADASNELAQYWRGVSGVYLLRNDMPPEERAEPMADLVASLERAGEDDPQLLHAMAVWHYNEAGRLRDAAGGEITEASTEQFTIGRGFSDRAYAADPQDPLVVVNHLAVLMSSPLDDELREQIGQVLLPFARRLSESEDTRAELFPAELSRVVGWLSTYTSLNPDDEEALPLALAIGERYAADKPNRPDHHQVHAQALLAHKDYEAAIPVLEQGIAATRRLGPEDYLIDLQTRVAMIAQLADANINLAMQSEGDARAAYLAAADQALTRYNNSEGADTRFHEARASYLAGRAAFVQNTPHLAVPLLENANAYYKNSDLQTLALLAKAHDANGNLGTAAEHYELLLQREPRARNERLRLVQLYTQLGGDKLALADAHISRFLEYNPGDLQALLLRANLAATLERYDTAAEIVASIGLEEYPELVATYAQHIARAGDPEQAQTLLRERLAAEPNDTGALSILLTLITDPQQQLALIDELEENGLDAEAAGRRRLVIENGGQMTIEDYRAFAEASGTDELLTLKQLYMAYAQSNQTQKMRETLAEMMVMAPHDVNVLEWRFIVALSDKDYALADRVIAEIMALPASERPRLAAGEGVFLRARVLAARAQDADTPDLRDPIRAYRRALEDNLSYAPGWVELGRLYMTQQDWPRAVESLTRAYRIQPTNLQAAMLLARSLRASGEPDLALDIYRSATRRQPNNRALREEYLALESTAGVRRLAMEQREAIRDTNPDDLQNRQALAIMLAEDSRYEDALAEIATMEADHGVTLTTAYARASVHAMAEDPQSGVDTLQGYIADRGEETDANDYLALATYLTGVGRADEAGPVYEQAMALEDPQTRRASRERAAVLARRGGLEEAAALLQDLGRSFPDEEGLRYDLALVYIAMGNATQAEATLGQVSDSAQKQKLRAQLQNQLGHTDAALAIVRDALETYEDNRELSAMEAQLLTRLADADFQAGNADRGRERLTQARAIYDRLVRSNSSLYEQRVLIARIDERLGARDAAIDQLIRLLDENPSVASARVSLFNLYINRAAALNENDPRRAELAQMALSTIAPLVQEQPENLELLRKAGFAARESGNTAAALGYAQTAYDQTGEAQDLAGLVATLLMNNQPREAIVLLDKPEHATDLAASGVLRGMHARALANSGRQDEARNLFGSLLRRAEGEADQLQIIAQIRLSSLRGEQITIVEDALGDDISSTIDLQLALIEQAQERWEDVVRRLSPWVQSPASNPQVQRQAMLSLALSYQQVSGQDNLLRAKEIYEGLLGDNPNPRDLELYNNLAYLLVDPLLGDIYSQQAIDYAKQAVALINDNMPNTTKALILDTLGWAQYRAGEHRDAIATLRQSMQHYELPVNQKHLGQVYMDMGNDDQALRYLDDARVDSDDPAERAEIQALIDQVRNRAQTPTP